MTTLSIFGTRMVQAVPKVKRLCQDEFYGCCGIDILAYFPENDITDKDIKDTQVELDEQMAGKNPNSMMLVSLLTHQRKHFDKMLKDKGFRVLMAEVYHPSHGNYITLYGWQKYKPGDKLPPALDDEDDYGYGN